MTRWANELTPENAWQEYPRPQLRRAEWLNLNGLWEYAITPKDQVGLPDFNGQILVPFPLESALSGVKRALQANERLWYRRTFQVPESWRAQRVLLQFGAVDWEATAYINGVCAGNHRGGYLPFWFNITQNLHAGENELIVSVWDPTDSSWQQRGKQVRSPKSIWYTQVSGIWQTVWLEPVPATYIAGLKITPDIDAESVQVAVQLAGEPLGSQAGSIKVYEQGTLVTGCELDAAHPEPTLDIHNPKLWSPDTPHLYDLVVELGDDRVESYFGMRKFSLGHDSFGRSRLCLNNAPIFQYGPLDQGYWPDGLYTPASETALRFDLELVKRLGCNMLRKHIKVEPARFYYECDRMGLIVWQDMINGGKPVGDVVSFLAILVGLNRRDDRSYRYAGRQEHESRQDYQRELRELVDHLYNYACIGVWVPFNEGWGQFDARATADWLKAYDPTRLVDHASGWFDQGGGDLRSLHVYFKKLSLEKPAAARAVVLSEFGGYSMKVAGHTWNPQAEFGYRKYSSPTELTEAYLGLLENELEPWITAGLSAAIYTQAVDVEIEVNGYLTYDREVEKMDFDRISAAHRRLFEISSG
jgi:beta-galactosidase/beta-glucuronidase